MRNQEHLLSPGTHPGVISGNCSTNTIVEGLPLAMWLSIFGCAIHGPNPVVSCSGDGITNFRGNARLMDICACGCALLPPATKTFTDK